MSSPLDPALFDLDPRVLWVMHCAEGPVPKASAEAVRAMLGKELRPWTMRFKEDFVDGTEQVRAACARLVGGRAEDITLSPTTTSALTLVAQGFPWAAGDEVLAPLGEFPTNSWPWLALRARGVSLREVPLWEGHRAGKQAWSSSPPPSGVEPEERLLAAIGPRTRVMTVSWVRFQDGLVLDLPRLARGCAARGVALVVDGIQGAGTLPVPLEGLSAYATGGYKGLLAPEGMGFLWTDEAFRALLAPVGGWLSVEGATDFARPSTDLERPWRSDGQKLEQGGYDLLSGAALEASLNLLNDTGLPAIAAHVRALAGELIDGLAQLPAWRDEAARLRALLDAGRLGPVVSLHHGARGLAGLQKLMEDGFKSGIYTSVREGYLRVAFHGFHQRADVPRLLSWLA